MKYVDEYRDSELAQHIAQKIHTEALSKHDYCFMEFCGGHTHAIFRYGIPDLLPDNVRMIHVRIIHQTARHRPTGLPSWAPAAKARYRLSGSLRL